MTSAHELTKTHFCKTPGCENEARSPVGRYAYCPEHQGTATPRRAVKEAAPKRAGSGTAGALLDLLSLAKQVDKAKAGADRAQSAANEAGRKADQLEQEYKDALAAAARGMVA